MLANIWNFIVFDPIHNLLTYLYVLTGSLGISTILLIIIIKILLWPMVAKQYRDTKKVRSLQPRLEELKEKYKNDAVGMAKAQQDVYKEVNYNPLGCFTNFILQIPILIALYQAVLAFTTDTPATVKGLYPFVAEKLAAMNLSSFATDLFGIQLLSTPAAHFAQGLFSLTALPYLVLMILLAASNILPTWISMKFMNTQVPKIKSNTDAPSDQQAMQDAFSSSLNTSTLYIMPIMITLTMTPLPSVVTLYMIAQNIISSAQQIVVKMIHDVGLKKKLIQVLVSQYKYDDQKATATAQKLLKFSPAINFLVDEFGDYGKVKTTSIKVHDTTFAEMQKKHKDVIEALMAFDTLAKTPVKKEVVVVKAA